VVRSDPGRMCPAARLGRIMIMSTAYQHWIFTPAADVEQGVDLGPGAPEADPEADRSGACTTVPLLFRCAAESA
jgi:hypothetical protein